jgi:hypothetical protein
MKALLVFLFILSLLGPFFFFLPGMIILEGGGSGDLVRVSADYINIFPVVSIAAAALLLAALILVFKFPKTSGIAVVTVCVVFLIIISIMDVRADEDVLHKICYIYIITGISIFFIRGKFTGIYGRKHLNDFELEQELQRGGKIVRYRFAFSIIVMSFKRTSPAYFIPAGKKSFAPVFWSIISVIFGLWGIPWGPIFVFQTVKHNIEGGEVIK